MIPHSRPFLSSADKSIVEKQLESGLIAQGEKVKEFENAVCSYLNVQHGLATSSGTAALILGLKALEIKVGDEVILPSYVCKSVEEAICQTGAVPVFCDTGDFWHMTQDTIADRISSRTKAIVLVHIFGINAFNPDLRKFNIPIIEDNCQAFGLEADHTLSSLQGIFSFYSFHGTKCLTTGEGGMLVFNHEPLYRAALEHKKRNDIPARMSDMQAALGLSQLSQYEQMKKRRKDIAARYLANLPSHTVKKISSVKDRTIFFRFPLEVSADIDLLIHKFAQEGIAVRRGVDSLLHRAKGIADTFFPKTTEIFNTTLSLPIHPSLSEEEVEKIIYIGNKLLK